MTAGEKRVHHARTIVVAAALLAAAAVLFLGRVGTFYFDEWSFILTAPHWNLATYLQPHNEHPSILSRALYSLLLHTAGLRTYLPYLAVSVAAHVANVVLLFELVSRRAGTLVAMSAAGLLMLLGAGWDDLLWAFQMAWLMSIAFGLATLLALQLPPTRVHLAIAATCLLLSFSFSGIGVPFAVAVAVQLGARAETRRSLLWFVPVAVAVGAWYLLFGRFGEHPDPQPTAANILLVPIYAAWGMSQSVAAVVGEGGWVGLGLLVLAAVAPGWRWTRHGPDAFSLGVMAGLVAFYLVTGLTRAQLGIMQSGSSRYVYVGAVCWLILLADVAQGLPWRGTWRPALLACLFLATFNSAVLLFSFATARTVVMERQVADYYALEAERTDACLNPDGVVDPLVMPSEIHPADYYAAIAAFGDPVQGRPLTDRASYEAGIRNLRRPGC